MKKESQVYLMFAKVTLVISVLMVVIDALLYPLESYRGIVWLAVLTGTICCLSALCFGWFLEESNKERLFSEIETA